MKVKKKKGGFLMKKSKLLVLGLIALMLVGSLFVLVSCGEKCTKDQNCVQESTDSSGNIKPGIDCGNANPINGCDVALGGTKCTCAW